MNDVLTARPTLPAKWDARGGWRCPQCGQLLAFVGHDLDGKPDVRVNEYLDKDGVWTHPENGFGVLPNARERGRRKHARKMQMRERGTDEDTIQAEMEGMDWLFESAKVPRQGWREKPDGTLEKVEARSLAGKTPRCMEVVTLPALFKCARCEQRVKISGVG